MGTVGGCCCYKHNDRRVSAEVQSRTGTVLTSSPSSGNFRENRQSSHGFHSDLVTFRRHTGDFFPYTSPLLPSVHAPQEKREAAAYNRPLLFEPSSYCSILPYGDSSGNFKKYLERTLGLLCGHRRCLLSRPHGLGLSQIPCLQTLGKDICVSVPSIWSESGTLGVHKSDKAHQESPPSSVDPDILLLRRLHSVRSITNSFRSGDRQDLGSAAKTRVQGELGQIQPSSSTGGGVLGRVLGFEGLFPISSSGQARHTQSPVSGDVPEVGRDKEGVGKFGRFNQLRRHICRAGKTLSASHHVVGESTHSSMFQRRVCSSRSEVQGVAEDLDVSGIFGPSRSYARFSAFSHSDDGRVLGRLVWDPSTSQSSWILGSRRFPILYELERAQSHSLVSCRVPEAIEGQDGAFAVRQHHSHLVPEKSGFREICAPAQPLNGNSGILQGAFDCAPPRTPQGSVERLGGPGFPASSSSYRVVPGLGDVFLGVQSGTSVSSGPIRYLGKCSAPPVCVTLPGRVGSGGQRIQLRLESLDIHLPLPSHELLAGRGESSPRVRGFGRPDSSLLAVEGVVSSSPPTLPTGANSPAGGILPESDDIEGCGPSQMPVLLESSRLDSVSRPWEPLLSEDSVRIVRNNHRKSTVRQYQAIWTKFLEFLSENHIPHHEVTVFVVMNFLSHHFVDLNRKYRTIAAYKCALAHPLFVNFGINFKDVRLDMYMRGVFNSNPPCASAPMPIWSLNDLLSYLASEHFEPLSSKSLYTVAQKTLCLILLASGRRIGEIAHLSKKHTHRRDGEVVTFHWLPQFLPKHCDSSFQPKMPSIERLASDNIQDLWLCPVRSLNTYLSMIGGGPRYSVNSPLWSYDIKGLTKMLQTTVLQSRQRVGAMELVPMGPHQVRKLAASYSAQMLGSSSASELKLMERMGCSSMSVLRRVYIKDVPCLNFKCVLPVGTFIPTVTC